MNIYIIYKTINLLTKRMYIGSHKTQTYDFDGYFGSSKAIKDAILKYGKSNFTRETLEIVWVGYKLSNKEWIEKVHPRETFWIKEYSKSHNLYNINIDSAFGGNTTEGTMWIHNKESGEHKMIKKYSEIENGWCIGRIKTDKWNSKQKGGKLYTNIDTNEEKRFHYVPEGNWILGSIKQNREGNKNPSSGKKWYMNTKLMQYCFCTPNLKPDGFINGHPDWRNFNISSLGWKKI